MAKAIASASEFITAAAGQTIPFDVNGVTVELRSLEWTETDRLITEYSKNPAEMTFQAAYLGLAKPKLDEAQLRSFMPGVIQKISAEVMRLSGMMQEEG